MDVGQGAKGIQVRATAASARCTLPPLDKGTNNLREDVVTVSTLSHQCNTCLTLSEYILSMNVVPYAGLGLPLNGGYQLYQLSNASGMECLSCQD